MKCGPEKVRYLIKHQISSLVTPPCHFDNSDMADELLNVRRKLYLAELELSKLKSINTMHAIKPDIVESEVKTFLPA
jgi:hypothetical protein